MRYVDGLGALSETSRRKQAVSVLFDLSQVSHSLLVKIIIRFKWFFGAA